MLGFMRSPATPSLIYYSLSESALIDLLSSLCGVSPKGQMKEKFDAVWSPMAFMRRWMKGGD